MRIKITDEGAENSLITSTPYYQVAYNVQGQDGDYFICNDVGHVFWLDDLSNTGVEWEYLK